MKKSDLAEAIRAAIWEAGVSANELGNRSGVARQIIGRFLRAERTVTVETAMKLLAALGCSVSITTPKTGTRTKAKG